MRILIDLQPVQGESRFRGIGRYALSLALAIAGQKNGHEVFIVLNNTSKDAVNSIKAQFGNLLPESRILVFDIPFRIRENNPADGWKTRISEIIREDFLNSLEPDVILTTSLFEGFLDDIATSVKLMPAKAVNAVIIYDLIPLMNKDIFFKDKVYKDYYMRKIEHLKKADILLSISDYTKKEAVESLEIDGERFCTIYAGCGSRFKPMPVDDGLADADKFDKGKFLSGFSISKPFVMYAGAFDRHKNCHRLIKAFASKKYDFKKGYQLVLAGKIDDRNKHTVLAYARSLNLTGKDVIMTGYVSDDDLIRLYNLCALFVFPSLHEGFGFPPLEAMSCGAAVIASNAASLPEVIGRDDAMFDPNITSSIEEKINGVLSNPEFLGELRKYSLKRAKKFSWDACAEKAIKAFEIADEQKSAMHGRAGREDWARIRAGRAGRRTLLIDAVASAVPDKKTLTNSDLIKISSSIYNNNRTSYSVTGSSALPQKITWRVEGPFDSSYSLALINRETARSLSKLGHEVILHSTEGPGDYPPNAEFLKLNPDIDLMYKKSFTAKPEDAMVQSRNLYPPRVGDMRSRLNLLHHYAWEETGFPHEWIENFNEHLGGITALSSHVKKILTDNGLIVPAGVSGCGIDHWERIIPDNSFKTPAKNFRFLHVSSCFPRKGIDVLLKSFCLAFTEKDDVSLIIKTFPNPHNDLDRLLDETRKSHAGCPDIIVIEKDLKDEQLKALYAQCHALVAPSRAEGFGLPLAEAMLSGLAVITTGWGGQLDFCGEDTAWLIDYSFKKARTHFNLFDSVWAEPDINGLAEILKYIYSLPELERTEKSRKGRNVLLDNFKWSDVTGRLISSARKWSTALQPPRPSTGWVTSWNVKCGIASYSNHLTGGDFPDLTIFAPLTEQTIAADSENVLRCWNYEDKTLEALFSAVISKKIDILVIQFNYGFFDLPVFSEFIKKLADKKIITVITLHSTTDPVHAPDKKLSILAGALKTCGRVVVHSINDLNNLKALGVVENVALFPHGIINYVDNVNKGHTKHRGNAFTIASYGYFLPHKGLMELIGAFSILLKKVKNITLNLKMINAEYPIPESSNLIKEAAKKIKRLGLEDKVELITDFLPDEISLKYLSQCDLAVFPYQRTGESTSAAVRYGIASGCNVAVSPLPIFDDIAETVWYLPGADSASIAEGIERIIGEIKPGSPEAVKKAENAEAWRLSHRYSKLGLRFQGMINALWVDKKIM